MSLQYSGALRNAQLDAIETVVGAAPVLEIRTGAPPANTAAADSGTLLASITLPGDWLAAANNGSKAIANGPWSDTSADGTGTAGHFRIKAGGTTHIQGTVGQGAGDLQLVNASIVTGQPININSFTISAGNS